MTNRENVLRALRRDNPERVPFDFVLCPSHADNFEKKTGTRDYQEYFGFPFRYVDLEPSCQAPDLHRRYYKNLPANYQRLSWNPEWGVYSIPGQFEHFEQMLHPMAGLESADEIDDYPFPDFNESYRWKGFNEKVSAIKNADLIAVVFMQMTIFEVAWYMRGMDNLMTDMMADREFAEKLFEKITCLRIGMAEKYARSGIDILMLGDDVSTQQEMMISPALWQELLKPRLARVIRAAKSIKPDLLVFYHGDGNLQKIIPDLIEIGVDILNPVQPECMDPVTVKKLYGDRLSFWGTIGTQTVMPFGKPSEVSSMVKKMIKEVGAGGGLLVAPTHTIEPEVPWENIEAFIEAVKQYGEY
ncbi:MAG: hypothetical protein LBN21_09575 [Treponema sp.]|jgi:uroporphyrinogen decarboxylase|nr:hypothetical protein [Treponema sp.]